ncbi:helix-turn-helix transcriptional regulator [Nocardioides sp. W3-2-3]|nr:helix-turn-helix transcriptional regulator [Nocardioides convexus]
MARDVFVRHGYQGTAVEDIAAAAGVTRTLIYKYFADKDEIYLECLRAARTEPGRRRRLRRRLDDHARGPGSAPASVPTSASSVTPAPPGTCSSAEAPPSRAGSPTPPPATATTPRR